MTTSLAQRQRFAWRALGAAIVVLPALTAGGCSADAAHSGAEAPAYASCTLVDTDFDIDDMMAIPLVTGGAHVAAIVTSEGYTKAEAGAAALTKLLAVPAQRSVPVIVGANTDRTDASIAATWGDFVLQYRALMNRLNDSLPVAPPATLDANRDYVADVTHAVASCERVDVLVIGTFSSFVGYAPALGAKLKNVVVMGKPLEGDTSQRPGNYSFNCEYDMPACTKAFRERIPGATYTWVDVPRTSCDTTPNAEGCVGKVYGPNGAMVNGLVDTGLPGALKRVLLHNPKSWDIDDWPNATYGGKSLLWDQSAALYLFHPEWFTMVGGTGGHYETTADPQAFRTLWTDATNRAATIR